MFTPDGENKDFLWLSQWDILDGSVFDTVFRLFLCLAGISSG